MAEPFGRYQLVKRLGGGGMGEVFVARQAGLGGFEKLCVVKLLLPSLAEDAEFVAMFLDEAKLAARLSHPNVGQVFDVGQVDGTLYMAMEYIRGEDLAGLQKRMLDLKFSLPPAYAARIVADAAAGLQHAHQLADAQGKSLGLIHRDVSPPNIIVTFEGEVKIIDFGLARAAGRATQTKGGMLKGKFAYMSPEQVAASALDHRADIFALGIVLHELLTGTRLFRKDGDMQTLAAVAQCDVPAPSSLNPQVPGELDQVVLKALSKNRDDRYRDAQSMRFALEEWLRTAREPSSSVHVAKFMEQLYRDRLETERTKGPLWDAPEGPVSKIRPHPSSSTLAPVRPSPTAVLRTEDSVTVTRNAPPPTGPTPLLVRRRWIVLAAVTAAMVAVGAYWFGTTAGRREAAAATAPR